MRCTSPSVAIIDNRFTDEDRNQFLTLLNDHADDRRVLVHGHTLMSNHLHLVVTG